MTLRFDCGLIRLSVYSKLTKSYENIESEYWLEGMNFRCMKRPEMDVNTGNGRITGLRIQISRDLLVRVLVELNDPFQSN